MFNYCFILLFYNCFHNYIVLLFYYFIILLFYYFIISLFYYFIILLYLDYFYFIVQLFLFFQSRVPAFRERYVQFWFHLSEQLQSSEDIYVASKEGLHMLKVITDQLVSLSR